MNQVFGLHHTNDTKAKGDYHVYSITGDYSKCAEQ